jgi:hypothetical protein
MPRSLRIRPGRPRTVGHHDERAHLVMNVASECHHARLAEMNRSRLILREQLELELLGRRKE